MTESLVEVRHRILEWSSDPDLLSARCAKAEQQLESASRLLLDIEGSLLAYWTDIPQDEVGRLTVAIRGQLGAYEPAAGGGASTHATAKRSLPSSDSSRVVVEGE